MPVILLRFYQNREEYRVGSLEWINFFFLDGIVIVGTYLKLTEFIATDRQGYGTSKVPVRY